MKKYNIFDYNNTGIVVLPESTKQYIIDHAVDENAPVKSHH